MEVEDIVDRLYHRKRYWYHGNPTIRVEGTEGQFGKLIFDFGDDTVSFGIYLFNKEKIARLAESAIRNFDMIVEHYIWETS